MYLNKDMIEKAREAYNYINKHPGSIYIKMRYDGDNYIKYMVIKDNRHFGKGYHFFEGGEYRVTYGKDLFE